MKAIIQCYTPKEIDRIARCKQTIKVCKSAPKETPFKVYMYCTKQKVNGEIFLTYDKKIECRNRGFRNNGDIPISGKVVGDYVCERVDTFRIKASCVTSIGDKKTLNEIARKAGIRTQKLEDCFISAKKGKALYISAVKFYDKPKELGDFVTVKCTHKNGSCSDCEIKPNCIKYLSRPPRGWQYVGS